MAEYLTKVILPAAGSAAVPIPTNGGVLGVYSTSPITIGWEFNGEVGQIAANVSVWEPHTAFIPSPFSKLIVTAAAAADIAIRMV